VSAAIATKSQGVVVMALAPAILLFAPFAAGQGTREVRNTAELHAAMDDVTVTDIVPANGTYNLANEPGLNCTGAVIDRRQACRVAHFPPVGRPERSSILLVRRSRPDDTRGGRRDGGDGRWMGEGRRVDQARRHRLAAGA
jgi:hypothetical protein